MKELDVVLEPDETGIACVCNSIDIEIGDAEEELRSDGQKKENADQQKRRRKEEPRCGIRLGRNAQ